LTEKGSYFNIPDTEYPDTEKIKNAPPNSQDMKKTVSNLDTQMLIVRDFIDEFYNKTMFQKGGSSSASDLNPTLIKSLYAFQDANKAYPIGELGRNARVKSSTITDMVDRLERDGIAERFKNNGDRRVIQVRLTAKGKKMRREFTRKSRQGFEMLFAKLQDVEKKNLLHHLEAAYQILKKI
jgi:DNA-binding MarR family transcriptional regulator